MYFLKMIVIFEKSALSSCKLGFFYQTDAVYTYCYTIFFIVSTTTEDTSPLGLFLGKIFLHSISFWEEKFVDSSTNL